MRERGLDLPLFGGIKILPDLREDMLRENFVNSEEFPVMYKVSIIFFSMDKDISQVVEVHCDGCYLTRMAITSRAATVVIGVIRLLGSISPNKGLLTN